jgi:hypothetical protein
MCTFEEPWILTIQVTSGIPRGEKMELIRAEVLNSHTTCTLGCSLKQATSFSNKEKLKSEHAAYRVDCSCKPAIP